jgi:ketosteroid isomerase-like protein
MLIMALAIASTDVDRIEDLRAESNAAIAAHSVEGVMRAIDPTIRVLRSNGGFAEGNAAMREVYVHTFNDPAFVTFTRTPDQVVVNGTVASESGRWTGIWRSYQVSGPYLARWSRQPDGAWRIVMEMYVPTSCDGDGCASR